MCASGLEVQRGGPRTAALQQPQTLLGRARFAAFFRGLLPERGCVAP